MKIVYIRPYTGEIERLKECAPEYEYIAVTDTQEMDESTRNEVSILSVFVDYEITTDVLDRFPNLQCIATRSAGYDHINMEEAQARGIVVSRVPHYGARTVAEYAIALMFALSRNAFRSYTDLQRDVGVTNLETYEGFDLCGKTVGVVGAGTIGKSVCEVANGIGMKVLAYDVSPDESFANEHAVTYVSLDELLTQSDIVTLHVPSTPETQHLINEDKLRKMKSGSYLINTARGDVVDTKALVQVLHEGHLAGAGLDVLEGEHSLREEAELLVTGAVDTKMWETLVADHALIDMPNVIVTPHIAFNSKEAKQEITDITIANIRAFIAGEPQHTITV